MAIAKIAGLVAFIAILLRLSKFTGVGTWNRHSSRRRILATAKGQVVHIKVNNQDVVCHRRLFDL